MPSNRSLKTPLILAAVASALVAGSPAVASGAPHPAHAVCRPVVVSTATCDSVMSTDANGNVSVDRQPVGLIPGDLRAAYGFPDHPAASWTPQTVAIVTVGHAPHLEEDLADYRRQLKLAACVEPASCFERLDQRGQKSLPATDNGFAFEATLDAEMISAVCPQCRLLLVEADTRAVDDVMAAEDIASAGATVVDNSFGVPEFQAERNPHYQNHLEHDGTTIVASSGDSGNGLLQFPATSPAVVAVGGTTLRRDSAAARGWSESAWSGSTSGCSAYFSKPAWQTDDGCRRRTVVDMAAVADPETGPAVFVTLSETARGWVTSGGTSVSAALVAGAFGLAGNADKQHGASAAYRASSAFNDVLDGTSGPCGTYLCNAAAGFDGPTGLGSPAGLAGL